MCVVLLCLRICSLCLHRYLPLGHVLESDESICNKKCTKATNDRVVLAAHYDRVAVGMDVRIRTQRYSIAATGGDFSSGKLYYVVISKVQTN